MACNIPVPLVPKDEYLEALCLSMVFCPWRDRSAYFFLTLGLAISSHDIERGQNFNICIGDRVAYHPLVIIQDVVALYQPRQGR